MDNKTVTTGDKALDFTYTNSANESHSFAEKIAQAKKTYLIFLRYYGCTICQLDIKAYNDNYTKFTEKNAQILLVLQSKPEIVSAGVEKGNIAFEIACDPDQKLYNLYQVKAATGTVGMVIKGILPTLKKLKTTKSASFEHGEYEGNEYQLPAVFLLDSDMNILFDHRAKFVADIPDVSELIAKL